MKKVILSLFIASSILSCSSDDDVNFTPQTNSITAPATYQFSRNNATSVSFSGQTTRIAMAEELASALKVETNTEAGLLSMFDHQAGNADFSDANLNASDKNIKSKIAASNDFFSANTTLSNMIKADFDTWISSQANNVFPNWNTNASAGVAGQLQQSGGGAIRYVDAKGIELNQVISKGIIGGLMIDQMLNNYLSPSVLDAGTNIADNNADVLESGKNYTSMEHKWDEAFGYLYGAELDAENPILGVDSFLNEYLERLDSDADFSGIASRIYNAFKLGRAAIVAKDYTLRDQQAAIIRGEISKVPAVRAVYYLQSTKTALAANDPASAFHALSEGFGFAYSLQFTREPNTFEPYFTNTEVTTFLNQLTTGNGFWDVTPATLDSISQSIADRFGFTIAQAL
jgi:hypothetical protein